MIGARATFKRGNISLLAFFGQELLHEHFTLVVTVEALEPFRKPLPAQDPEPLSYLQAKSDFTFDIRLEAKLKTASMDAPHVVTRARISKPLLECFSTTRHHTVNGCNLQPGDLLASGTISGATEESRGCMLELTWRGLIR